MNLEILHRSRKRVVPGDVFVFRPKGRDYYFGCVVMVGTKVISLPDNKLIYLYDIHAPGKLPVPDLDPKRLLVHPIVINNLPWSRGYFEVVEHRALSDIALLKTHCLRRSNGRYFNELGEELPHRIEPCGDFALDSFRTIDCSVSEALGIPWKPDEDAPTRL